ncbi:Protein FecR [compost metagenome]
MSAPGQDAPFRPLDADILRQASVWMARMWAPDVSEEDKRACAQWRTQHPDHESAWAELQFFERKLQGVPPAMARRALHEPVGRARAGRRQALKLLGAGLVAGGIAYQAGGVEAWWIAVADHSTGTGEIRSLELPDGTQVFMDNASAIDLRFTAEERRVILRAGAIRVTTARDPSGRHRPFLVQSRDGTVQALGTRFTVRQNDEASRVAVFEGAVELRPRLAPDAAVRINAGQEAAFSADRVFATEPADPNGEAWTRGVLVADGMRVGDFVVELARYRRGWLRCDPEVADLKVSGIFSLLDTDRALHNLTLGPPVEVVYRSRFWATVQARATPARNIF